ncbi:MAG: MucR family transcriptional regulator [Alphaproteobacteria bacterium]|nr:MucR family transcriptional regulator [Alphaproteobacteria bacterium]
MSDNITSADLLSFTTEIVSSYVSNHQVTPENLKKIIQTTYQVVSETARSPFLLRSSSPLNPAVPIEESVKEDYIVCLEDGKRLQMLKRHLKTVYKMSVEQYRERWGLPHDYPVVAPSYAKRRSQIAKNTGLGVGGRRKNFKRVTSEDQTQMGVTRAASQ